MTLGLKNAYMSSENQQVLRLRLVYFMRRLLLAPLILTFLSSVKAEETCMFVSQYQPDLTIEVSTKNVSGTVGLIKYKSSPIFKFGTNILNGYGGQYFVISPIPNSPTKEEEKLVTGTVVTIVGNQAGTKGTPENKRNRGQNKLFLPNFGRNYYYSVFTDRDRGPFTEKEKTILRAAEGFWIPSEICKKYVYHGW